MSFEAFAAWLRQELREGRLLELQVADLLAQRLLFDQSRTMIESEFVGKAVGFVANQRHVTDSVSLLLGLAARVFPGRMLYFEPVGYRLF